jgi:ADP-ribose pyrophosphatase YjhB (NUDIX family)
MTIQASARRSPAERIRTRIAHWAFLAARPMTLGVRGVTFDTERRVLLVRHGYVAGWHFPGGGVERGETCESALKRELEEEACVRVEGTPRLIGLYFNARVSPRDHVAVYVIDAFTVTGMRAPDHEIQEARFFPLDALPEGITRGTRARLAEILEGAPSDGLW